MRETESKQKQESICTTKGKWRHYNENYNQSCM